MYLEPCNGVLVLMPPTSDCINHNALIISGYKTNRSRNINLHIFVNPQELWGSQISDQNYGSLPQSIFICCDSYASTRVNPINRRELLWVASASSHVPLPVKPLGSQVSGTPQETIDCGIRTNANRRTHHLVVDVSPSTTARFSSKPYRLLKTIIRSSMDLTASWVCPTAHGFDSIIL
jgi:hypothetical protein